jgi:hypothetical protein
MKNFALMTLLVVVTVVLTLTFSASAAGPRAGALLAAPANTPAAPVLAAPPMPEHPHIHEALESMRAAHRHLEQAEPIFQGHREEAIKHLDAAIHEAEICMSMR